jgi:hypothetical protein
LLDGCAGGRCDLAASRKCAWQTAARGAWNAMHLLIRLHFYPSDAGNNPAVRQKWDLPSS